MSLIGRAPIMAVRIVLKKDPHETLQAIRKVIDSLVVSGVNRDDIAVFLGTDAIMQLQKGSEYTDASSGVLYPPKHLFSHPAYQDNCVNPKDIYVTVLSDEEKYQKSVKARHEASIELQKQIMESYCNFKTSLPKLDDTKIQSGGDR